MKWSQNPMAYLYQVSLNRDPDTPEIYTGIYCYRIEERHRIENKGDPYFKCAYYRNGRLQWKRAGIEEGVPYGRSFAFWLTNEDEDRALDIFKNIFTKKRDSRRIKIKNESKKLLWENSYISNLSKQSIKYR